VEEYKQYIRNLGKAGIYYTTYAHMGNGIWSSGRATIRGASGREFDMASPDKRGTWDGKSWQEPLSHGRVFTKEEIWENYTHFIKQVAPVAEEAGVRIGIHPDDPPVPVLAGVPRCIFGNFEGYKRALEIANSPNVGICLCCGTWLEGGKQLTGKDVVGAIRYWQAGQALENPLPQCQRPSHFHRNICRQRLHGYVENHASPARSGFRWRVIGDHFSQMVGGDRVRCLHGRLHASCRAPTRNSEELVRLHDAFAPDMALEHLSPAVATRLHGAAKNYVRQWPSCGLLIIAVTMPEGSQTCSPTRVAT
jgi:mannonate dehydratase